MTAVQGKYDDAGHLTRAGGTPVAYTGAVTITPRPKAASPSRSRGRLHRLAARLRHPHTRPSPGAKMPDPTGLTLKFDQPAGGYPQGSAMTATLAGTADEVATEYTLTGTLTSKANPQDTASVAGSYTVLEPDELAGSVGGDSGGRTWTPGTGNGQAGVNWSGTFTSTA